LFVVLQKLLYERFKLFFRLSNFAAYSSTYSCGSLPDSIAFGRTALGYTIPKLSSFVLTIALSFLVVMIIIDNIHRPKRPKEFPLWRYIFAA